MRPDSHEPSHAATAARRMSKGSWILVKMRQAKENFRMRKKLIGATVPSWEITCSSLQGAVMSHPCICLYTLMI
eukprot:8966342-Karenia_brevis.AAC.1